MSEPAFGTIKQVSRHLCILAYVGVCALALLAQSDTGELRLKVTDQAGLPIPSSVELVSQANQVRQKLEAAVDGTLVVKRLPFGVYRLRVERPGFAPLSELVEIRSSLPRELRVTLGVAPIETVVTVNESETLVDPHRSGTVNRIGSETLQDRITAQPGRSLLDLLDTQPGWLLEANGVLHPRGSEYQTQYVVDGIPLTENRSPAFAPELEADDVQSMSVLTAGYPAEYGRKLGGVIEVSTVRDARPGFHGKAVLSGGSFDTAGGDLSAQYGWGRNTLSASGDGARTDRYLDPPVEENYTNAGTNASFAAHYERDLSDSDRFGLIVRRGQSRFQIPNELVQQEAGQRQDRGSEETAGQFSYQHISRPTLSATCAAWCATSPRLCGRILSRLRSWRRRIAACVKLISRARSPLISAGTRLRRVSRPTSVRSTSASDTRLLIHRNSIPTHRRSSNSWVVIRIVSSPSSCKT